MKKFLAIFLVCATLISMLVLPTAAGDTTAQAVDFPYVNDISDRVITVDGIDDEDWASLNYSLLDTHFYAGTKGKVPEEKQSKIRIGTDGKYVYVYYETERYNHGAKPLLDLYMNLPGYDGTKRLAIIVGGDSINRAHSNGYDSLAVWKVVAGTTTTVAEVRLEIPAETQKKMQTGAVGQSWINAVEIYDRDVGDEGMAVDPTSGWGANIQFALPKIVPVEDPTVKRVASNTVKVDGVRDDNEGWAKIPYLRLDQHGYYGAKVADLTPTKVYLSTDSEFLYVLVESNNRVNDGHTMRIAANFGSGKGNFAKKCTDISASSSTELNAPTLSDYGGTDKSSFATDWKGMTVYTESTNTTIMEVRIPLNNAVKSEMLKGDFDIKIGFLEHPDESDGGYHPTEGYEWNNTAKVPVTLPQTPTTIADGETRFVGAQKRVTDESSDVRFLAAMGDYAAYECVGFDIVMNGTYKSNEDATKCYTVYTSIGANGATEYAEAYGGKYFFAFTLTGLEKSTTYTFDVTSYTKKAGADKVSGATATVKVIVDANGDITFG